MKSQFKQCRVWPTASAVLELLMLGSVIQFAVLSSTFVFAQESMLEPSGETEQKELETDRDAFTPAMTTVGREILVLESTYTFIDNRASADTHSFPELLTRYGVSDWIELRLGWNYEIGGGNPVTGTNSAGAESDEGSHIFYGAKFQLTEQENSLPTSFFMAQGFTPTSGLLAAAAKLSFPTPHLCSIRSQSGLSHIRRLALALSSSKTCNHFSRSRCSMRRTRPAPLASTNCLPREWRCRPNCGCR